MKPIEPEQIKVLPNRMVKVKDLVRASCRARYGAVKEVMGRAGVEADKVPLPENGSTAYAVPLSDAADFLCRFRDGMIRADKKKNNKRLWTTDEDYVATLKRVEELDWNTPIEEEWPPNRVPQVEGDLVEADGVSFGRFGEHFNVGDVLRALALSDKAKEFAEQASFQYLGSYFARFADADVFMEAAERMMAPTPEHKRRARVLRNLLDANGPWGTAELSPAAPAPAAPAPEHSLALALQAAIAPAVQNAVELAIEPVLTKIDHLERELASARAEADKARGAHATTTRLLIQAIRESKEPPRRVSDTEISTFIDTARKELGVGL